MSDRMTWLIGSAPDCDLVVDRETVSAHHCQLVWTAPVFVLEDLQSTNGTFVNGQRVVSSVPVTRADEICLGSQIPMPWPESQFAMIQAAVTIGREPANDIVLDYPMVSGYHARLIVEGGRTFLEDAGSTNGIAIGSPECPSRRFEISSDDTVYFGSFVVTARELLDKAKHHGENHQRNDRPQAFSREATPHEQPPESPARRPLQFNDPRFVVAALVAFCGLIGIAWFGWTGGTISTDSASSSADHHVDQSQPTTTVTTPNSSAVTNDAPSIPANHKAEAEKTADEHVVAAKAEPVGVAGSVYAVLVASEDRQQVYQVGTAWAVSPQQLVTSATVVLAVKSLRATLATALVRNPSTNSEHFVVERAHPRFLELTSNANQLQAKLVELERHLTQSNDATEKQKLEQKLQELDLQLVAQFRESMYFDIGILEVRNRLPHFLPLADAPTASGQRLRLAGVPFPEVEQLLNPDRPPAYRELTGQLLARLPDIESAAAPLVFNAPLKDLQGQQWSGAPVLNSAGQVVGLFSRLAPPDIKSIPDPKQLRPHATDIRVLRDLIASGK